ncbi:unnamed protein product [Phytophthora fragariaefolia]|uniref:Unnamed protein product n=1 Tax=Phytophthora fragariaefolia TaxID=1490495 RepID=A0A9W6XNG5_9STRA|nr:unnamed protein product [Phytophthora fragariaefolia]
MARGNTVPINVQEVASASWASVWGVADDSKTLKFYEAKAAELTPAAGAADALKPLRKHFSLLAITHRPRVVEKQTREWLDQHFSGVFDKLVFVDEDSPEHLAARKKELYDELKVKVAVGSDVAVLTEAAEDVGHVVVVGSVPWAKESSETRSGEVHVAEWPAAKEVFDRLVTELQLQPIEKLFPGPRLARYTDDLVTVSTRKPAASEAAITTAVQAAEILRIQNNAVATKISTRYALNRPKDRGGYRVPKLELVLQRVARKA